MKTIEVNSRSTERLFIVVAKRLYKNDPVWVCPLDNEIKALFNPKKNPYYANGDSKRWILLAENNKPIGRIAAFFNTKKASVNNEQPTGGIGFFECINNKDAAFYLFDTAKEWLNSMGMEAMDGPINIGETDANWGLLVDGYMHHAYGMNYNPPYYKEFFESYGFQVYFEQYTFSLDITVPFPERFWKIADWVLKKNSFRFEHFLFSKKNKFFRDLVYIYNNTWNFKADFTPIKESEVRLTFNKARFIIDEELIWFAYHGDEPVAFFIFFPDVNQILKHLNGKLNPINIARFFYLKRKSITRFRAIVAGVLPKYQNSGIESAIFKHLQQAVDKKPYYTEVELGWVGDFNKKMQLLYKNTGAKLIKTHRTYRYLFDRQKEFKRFMPEETFQLERSHS